MTLIDQYGSDGTLNGVPQETLIELLQNITSGNTKKKVSKSKKIKDPNAPKRGRNAYMVYVSENRESIKEELGETAKNKDVMSEAGKRWREMSDEEKAPYNEQAEIEKKRYAEEKLAYDPPKIVETEPECPAAPDGWYGPFLDTYMGPNVQKPEGGSMPMFKTFEEAVEAANKIEGCGGIVKSKGNGKYSLRVGPDLRTGKYAGVATWTKTPPPQWGAPAPAPLGESVVTEGVSPVASASDIPL